MERVVARPGPTMGASKLIFLSIQRLLGAFKPLFLSIQRLLRASKLLFLSIQRSGDCFPKKHAFQIPRPGSKTNLGRRPRIPQPIVFVDPAPPGSLQTIILHDPTPSESLQTNVFVDPASRPLFFKSHPSKSPAPAQKQTSCAAQASSNPLFLCIQPLLRDSRPLFLSIH